MKTGRWYHGGMAQPVGFDLDPGSDSSGLPSERPPLIHSSSLDHYGGGGADGGGGATSEKENCHRNAPDERRLMRTNSLQGGKTLSRQFSEESAWNRMESGRPDHHPDFRPGHFVDSADRHDHRIERTDRRPDAVELGPRPDRRPEPDHDRPDPHRHEFCPDQRPERREDGRRPPHDFRGRPDPRGNARPADFRAPPPDGRFDRRPPELEQPPEDVAYRQGAPHDCPRAHSPNERRGRRGRPSPDPERRLVRSEEPRPERVMRRDHYGVVDPYGHRVGEAPPNGPPTRQQHLDPSSAAKNARQKRRMEAMMRTDSLSSDPSDCVRPPPPKPHKHRRNKTRRQNSLSSSEEEIQTTPECTSGDEQEIESESVSEKGGFSMAPPPRIRVFQTPHSTAEHALCQGMKAGNGTKFLRPKSRSFLR